MNANTITLIVVPLVSALGVLIAAVWGWRRPSLDKAQVEDLIAKKSRWRDARLLQYDRYFDEQDLPWHRAMTRTVTQLLELLEQAKVAGFLPPDAVIPEKPPPSPILPEPPPYD